MQNNYRVLIAACDTFRSGAVEQLRTHAQHLSALNPPQQEGAPANIMLYDRGYKKDPSGVAMEAIRYGMKWWEMGDSTGFEQRKTKTRTKTTTKNEMC